MRSTFFILLFFISSLSVSAQKPHPILRSFTALKHPNGVNLKWVIKGGQQCFGIRIFRADESLTFDEIDHIDGVCGDTEEDETYTYFDSEPISNSYNNYRLEMGSQGYTDTIQVFFEDFGSDRYLFITENASNSFRILFTNDNNRDAVLKVFDVSGKLMYEEMRTDNNFTIQPSGWRSGTYVFRISGIAQTDMTGKFYFSGL